MTQRDLSGRLSVGTATQTEDLSRRFQAALSAAAAEGHAGGIRLREKTLHTVLKHYCKPDVSRHEIRFGRYVVDILGEDGVTEIQTRDFSSCGKSSGTCSRRAG